MDLLPDPSHGGVCRTHTIEVRLSAFIQVLLKQLVDHLLGCAQVVVVPDGGQGQAMLPGIKVLQRTAKTLAARRSGLVVSA
jgi:hypothetical protein